MLHTSNCSEIQIGLDVKWWGGIAAARVECVGLCLGGQESMMAQEPPLNQVLGPDPILTNTFIRSVNQPSVTSQKHFKSSNSSGVEPPAGQVCNSTAKKKYIYIYIT